MRFLSYFTLLLLLSIPEYLQANETSPQHEKPQYPEVVIGGSQERRLQSEIIQQEYKLWISLPRGYQGSDQTYPVIYLLDAQWDFTLMVSLYGQLNYDGDIPDAVLVGITWGGENPDPGALRIRDFTPTKVKDSAGSGGAENFLAFIQKELVPFIEKEYRVNSDRYLMGSSLGGLFTFYALFEDPAFFSGYLPTAPSLWWDDEVSFNLAKKSMAKHGRYPTRLYSAAGEFDGVLPGFKKMQSLLDSNQISGLTYKTQLFDNMGHSAIKANGNVRGLQFLFKKEELVLSSKKLQRLSGKYFDEEHDINLEMAAENNRLVAIFEDGSKQIFIAHADNQFKQRGANVNVTFSSEDRPLKFEAKTFDGIYRFSRVSSEN